jgi:hypothetical protein
MGTKKGHASDQPTRENGRAMPQVELFTLADRAEVVGTKLYLTGGLLDTFTVPALPAQLIFGLALVIKVPSELIGRPLAVRISLANPAHQEIAAVESGFDIPKPPRSDNEDYQRVVMAIPQTILAISEPGRYEAKVTLNGNESTKVRFSVQLIPQ